MLDILGGIIGGILGVALLVIAALAAAGLLGVAHPLTGTGATPAWRAEVAAVEVLIDVTSYPGP